MASGLTGTKGGSGVWQRIISEMPEHDVYFEPFFGRGTIARKKRPAQITVGIDKDSDAIACGHRLGFRMFQACGIGFVRDYFGLAMPHDLSTLEPVPGSADTCGGVPSKREGRTATQNMAASADACTFGGVPWEQHFVYFDPPYLKCSGYYRHELTEDEHRVLCRLFLRLPCPAAISGYWSDLYAEELRGSRSIKIPTVNRAGRPVTEVVWMNYEPPARYHDVRFVGSGRRERERIKRRAAKWSEGLQRMPAAERQAVLEACNLVCREIDQ